MIVFYRAFPEQGCGQPWRQFLALREVLFLDSTGWGRSPGLCRINAVRLLAPSLTNLGSVMSLPNCWWRIWRFQFLNHSLSIWAPFEWFVCNLIRGPSPGKVFLVDYSHSESQKRFYQEFNPCDSGPKRNKRRHSVPPLQQMGRTSTVPKAPNLQNSHANREEVLLNLGFK